MRIIPKNTKVQIELFRGVTLWDMLVGAIMLVLLALIVVSNLPFKLVFVIVQILIAVLLLSRMDNEPNYMYLIYILRHFGFKRKFDRLWKDDELLEIGEKGVAKVMTEEIAGEELPEPEEEEAKPESTGHWSEMEELSAFTDIKDGFVVYGKNYFGAVLEIPCVEFRFFSETRRLTAIESALGSVLRSINPEYSANIIKIERPVEYEPYINQEYDKLEELRASYEAGFISEDELKSRIAVVYDRIEALLSLKGENKVVIPFYYIALFDSDRTQLNNQVRSAIESLRLGEMNAKRLNDKELAVFLKYSNALDFDEKDIDRISPKDYAKWAMPDTVRFTPRMALVNGMATHNFRVTSFPTLVNDAWLATLMTYPSTKVIVKVKPMDSSRAIRAIDKSLSELRSTVNNARTDSSAMEAQTHIDTLQHLLSTLQGENETLLDVNIYVTAYDPMRNENSAKLPQLSGTYRYRTANMKKQTRRSWSEAGFRLNNMEFNQALAYIGSQVSGYDPMEKNGRGIPSNTVAACFPWVFPHIMDEKGINLGSEDGVPVFLDFFRRDSERVNSNMVIVGKSGSGKSYATKALLTNLAADDAKIFILDPENEYTELAYNLNGKFINVANAQYGRLNPFHIITTLDDDDVEADASGYATHLQFLEEFFKQILPDCDKDSLEYLNSLVDRVYSNKGINARTNLALLKPEDYPIFDDLYDEILREFQRTDNDYIKTMLRTLMNYISKFSEGGRNAIIWNGPSSITTDENFTVFNFQSLLSNRNTTVANAQMLLVLKYIDNEIIKNRDYNAKYNLNRKIVVVIDEAHVFIDTKYPVALDFMFQLAKRIRKYNGMQIVITQNIKDFVGSEEIARKSTAIINACQYSFIFSLAPNDMADLCKLYEKAGGINEAEQEKIIQAGRGEAFTILSPTSRSSFKVTVPDVIHDFFSKKGFDNPYFTGEGGAENWEDFMGDSSEKREKALAERKKKSLEATEYLQQIQTEETTYTDEDLQSAMAALGFTEIAAEDVPEPPRRRREEEINPADFADFKAELAAAGLPGADASKTAGIAAAAGLAAGTVIPAIAGGLTETPQPVIQTVVQSSSRTEELLADLVGKLGTDAMAERIRSVVREELEKERASRPAAPFIPGEEEDEDEDSDTSLGSIFDFLNKEASRLDEEESDKSIFDFGASDTDEQAGGEDQTEALEDTDDGGFDIMKFLSMQAEAAEESGEDIINEFIDGSETLLTVSLEQLMIYNRAKARK